MIVFLDADMQNPPHEIPLMINEMKKGYGIVSGWRKKRKDSSPRRFVSFCANWLISSLMGFRIHDYGCSLKVYRKEFLKDIQFIGDTHRLLLAYGVLNGATVKEMVVDHRPPVSGKSKYGFGRTFKVLLDLTVMRFFASYSTKPSHFFGVFGLLMTAVSIIIGIFVIIRYMLGGAWMSPLLIVASSAFFTGFNIIVLALAVEILYRGILKASDQKTYEIEE